MRITLIIIFLLFTFRIYSEENPNEWVYKMINIAQTTAKPNNKVKVAVIDDAFNLNHNSIKDFIQYNNNEIINNYRDDDQNGYIDDISGWDIADNDNDVSVIKGREKFFIHGTYIAGIIVNIFQYYYGENAKDYLEIIPVKALSDDADTGYLKKGYDAIQYAVQTDADIICLAWSGGKMGFEENAILNDALSKGKIIIAAAGNMNEEKILPPAIHHGVIAVTAVDSSHIKLGKSSYGMEADISAPGSNIYGPHPIAENSYIYESGTSPATAIVTGIAAILRSISPEISLFEIKDALKNTSKPIDIYNSTYSGKLGSGIPDVSKAIEYIPNDDMKYSFFNSQLPEGKLFIDKKINDVKISPIGSYKGIHFQTTNFDNRSVIKIFNEDSIFFSGRVSDLKRGVFVNSSNVNLSVENYNKDFSIDYYVQTIDSTSLYCSKTEYINTSVGTITDGSGTNNYANNSSCKWEITVPENKVIKIESPKLDTQPNVDFIYIFNGHNTRPENLLAKFSGHTKPPIISSFSNKVLIWFVTDSHKTYDGWKLDFKAVDPLKTENGESHE
jgi:hypothetical protein